MRKLLSILLLLFLSINAFAQIPSYVPSSGLVGYWPFNGNANDESGNGNNGTVNGATLTADRFGNSSKAYSFNGVNDYISCLNTGPIGANSISISFWLNSNAPGTSAQVIGWGQSQNTPGGEFRILTQHVITVCSSSIAFDNFQSAKCFTTDFTGSWDHYILVYDITNSNSVASATIYKNGVQLNQCYINSNSPTNVLNQFPIVFGKDHGQNNAFYGGNLDDIGIWNRALTQLEITNLYTETTPVSCLPSYVPTNGLVGYWPFCGNANDESGNGNNGTVNGATLTTDRFGTTNRAYSFNGVSDFINVPSNTGLNLIGNFTLSAWVKLANSGISNSSYEHHFILSKNGGITGQGTWHMLLESETNQPFQIHYNADPCFCLNTMGGTNSQINDINWHLINISYNSTNQELKYFLDGNLVYTSTQFNYTNQITTYDLLIGKENTGLPGFFNGKIDDIGIWNRALTQLEITNLYTQTTPVSCLPSYVPTNGLVGYWPFCGNANDESGNGNNGSVTGATLIADRNGNANSAYTFNNLNDVITVSNPNPALTNTSKTISTWFKLPNQFNYSSLAVVKHGTAYNTGFDLAIDQNNSAYGNNNYLVVFLAGNGGAVTFTSNQTELGNWAHLVTTYDGTDVKIYLNGVLKSSQPFTGSLNCPNDILYFGKWDNLTAPAVVTRQLDDIGIWNRALTQQEITNIYTGTVPTPTCAVTATDSTICAGETVTLTSNATNFSSSTPCASTELPSNLQAGLIGYWPFCGNANDASGNGNNGTVNGATLTADRFGNANSAYSFDGVNDFIQCIQAGPTGNPTITANFWIKTTQTTYGHLIGYGNNEVNGTNFRIYLGNGGCSGSMVFDNYGSALAKADSHNNTWDFYSIVYDSNLGSNPTIAVIYKNGVVLNSICYSSSSTNTNLSNILPIVFGRYHGTSQTGFYDGLLDDITLYNRVLSITEIQLLYAQGQTSYSWSNGATTPSISVSPTTTTTYTCTVANNGVSCTDDVTVVVDTPPTPIITASSSTNICAGGSVILTSSSATGNVWSTGATTQSILVSTAGNNSVTVTNATGCSATSALTSITVNALPTVNAGVDQTVCAGIAVTLSGSGATTYSWNNIVSNGASFTPTSTTTYTVTGTNTATGCTNTDQVVVNVNALPSVNAGVDQTVCAGTSVALSGSGANTYSWNNGVSNGIAFLPASTATYTVTGTNTATGCTNTDQVVVNVNALPSVNAGVDQTVCAGTSVTLSGTGANTYSWNNSVSNGIAFLPNSTATYTVTGTNTATGCTNTDQVVVNVNALPSVNAGVDQTVCAGTSVTLSGTGANTYSWNNSVSNGASFTPTSTTTYNVTGTNTATGCTNTDQIVVNVNALPSVNAGVDQTVCDGTSVTLSGTGANTYSWNNSVSNGASFTPTVTTTYSVTGTNTATGCTNTDQVVVNVNALPSVNAGIDQTVCAGTAVTLSGTGANTYSWNNGVSNGIAFIPASIATYTVTGTNTATGCTNSDQVVVNVNALPSVNAGVDQTVCAGTAVTLSGTGANTYSWNNGVSNGIAVTPASTTTYTVTGTNTATGCTNTDQVVVNVNALPSVNAGVDQTVCDGTAVTLSGTGANTYSWNNSVSNGASFTPTVTTTYTITGTNTATGCTNTDQVIINVNALPSVNAGVDQTVCAGTSVTLLGTGANTYSWNNSVNNGIVFTPASTATYTVTGTNTATGCTNTDQVVVTVNPLPSVNAGTDQMICAGTAITLNGSGANTYAWDNNVSNGVAFTPLASGTYTVTGTNLNGCTNADQVFVMVHILPSVNAGVDQSVCAGNVVTLSASGANSYAWNNNVSNGLAFTPTVSGSYTVTGTDGFGCTNTDLVTITVNPLPTVNAGLDQTLCQSQSTTLFGSGADIYSWTNNVTNGVGFLPTITQEYAVTGTNTTTGCSNTDQVIITVNPLPNVNAGTDQSICKGDAITLSGTGANAYTWNNNITNAVAFNPIATATYSVSGTDANGCINADEVIVTVNEASASTLTESAMDSYTLNGQTYTQSGTYTQVIPNASGCDSTITLNLTLSFTGITEIVNTNVLVYPNPTYDLLNIILPTEASVNYVLLDSRGRKVLEGSLNYTENQISLKACTPGAYFLKIGQDEVPIRVIKQ